MITNKKQETRNKKQEIVRPDTQSCQVLAIIGGEQKHQSVKTDGVCTCLCSSMGTGGGYVPLLVWE